MYPHTLIEWILETTEYPDQDDNGKDGQKVAILYDIGCNICKGIERVCRVSLDFTFWIFELMDDLCG